MRAPVSDSRTRTMAANESLLSGCESLMRITPALNVADELPSILGEQAWSLADAQTALARAHTIMAAQCAQAGFAAFVCRQIHHTDDIHAVIVGTNRVGVAVARHLHADGVRVSVLSADTTSTSTKLDEGIELTDTLSQASVRSVLASAHVLILALQHDCLQTVPTIWWQMIPKWALVLPIAAHLVPARRLNHLVRGGVRVPVELGWLHSQRSIDRIFFASESILERLNEPSLAALVCPLAEDIAAKPNQTTPHASHTSDQAHDSQGGRKTAAHLWMGMLIYAAACVLARLHDRSSATEAEIQQAVAALLDDASDSGLNEAIRAVDSAAHLVQDPLSLLASQDAILPRLQNLGRAASEPLKRQFLLLLTGA
jgi:hypothetical protein